ncbi:TetR/AcrR family transcriptional regulator [Agromyces italicus]|uniref:TetR/AcrR family transcriptional regulator n=1 Tax=Agromyces italicus TaxID=279572 RepID=UPI0003B381A2|nr:TetR/AcrR family transcriptional regulator [Agromyces italicus]
MRPSSRQKREAALRAAERQFLSTGYESVTMDSIAKECGVAKQTLYSHFGSKRALFLELVTAKTVAARRAVSPSLDSVDGPRPVLRELLIAQLTTVMSPGILSLRRLVIGELTRSPELAAALYEQGPRRAIVKLAALIAELRDAGALRIDDPERAASQLNWLVMGEPLNRAMLLGDTAIPSASEIEAQVDSALEVFFAAFGGTLEGRPIRPTPSPPRRTAQPAP